MSDHSEYHSEVHGIVPMFIDDDVITVNGMDIDAKPARELFKTRQCCPPMTEADFPGWVVEYYLPWVCFMRDRPVTEPLQRKASTELPINA